MGDTAGAMRENMLERARNSRAFSGHQAILYGNVYWALRISLIVLAALVAAGTKASLISNAQPYMAVAIVILTGLDTLIQPGTRWKIHYRYNDIYEAAETEGLGIPSDDLDRLDRFRLKLDAIASDYSKEALG